VNKTRSSPKKINQAPKSSPSRKASPTSIVGKVLSEGIVQGHRSGRRNGDDFRRSQDQRGYFNRGYLNGKDNPEEPHEARVSRTVLREGRGEIPPPYSIIGRFFIYSSLLLYLTQKIHLRTYRVIY
jgi:hypothetical protein